MSMCTVKYLRFPATKSILSDVVFGMELLKIYENTWGEGEILYT